MTWLWTWYVWQDPVNDIYYAIWWLTLDMIRVARRSKWYLLYNLMTDFGHDSTQDSLWFGVSVGVVEWIQTGRKVWFVSDGASGVCVQNRYRPLDTSNSDRAQLPGTVKWLTRLFTRSNKVGKLFPSSSGCKQHRHHHQLKKKERKKKKRGEEAPSMILCGWKLWDWPSGVTEVSGTVDSVPSVAAPCL